MKYFGVIFLVAGLISCSSQKDHSLALQNKIDSLEQKLAAAYKPGFGEFMSSVQVHHAKLWFAGPK